MRYLMNFSYDGSKFNGYQKQDNALTVQGNLEDLLSRRFNKEIKIYGSGRTDKGVHAINQYAHFDADTVEPDKLVSYLNEQMDGIFVKSIWVVDDEFHARFNVKNKTYKYVINVEDYDVFRRSYELEYCKSLDLDKMKDLFPLLKGEHDFENFTTIQDKKESYVREIFDIKIDFENGRVNIYITGNGFLRYMVRNIVGLLVSYSESKITKEEAIKIINKATDQKPVKVDGCGLYLYDVIY